MKYPSLFTSVVLGTSLVLASCHHDAPVLCDATHTVDFTNTVLPIITSNCNMSGCHNAKDAAEGVILTDYKHIMRQVSAGRSDNSELYEVLVETGSKRMPRDGSLPADQIATIKLWIDEGAVETKCQ